MAHHGFDVSSPLSRNSVWSQNIAPLLTTWLPTTGGLITARIPTGSFFGVLLRDAVFEGNAGLGIDAAAVCVYLYQGITVSNIAVQTPEPATAALLGLGVAGIVLARRKRAACRSMTARH